MKKYVLLAVVALTLAAPLAGWADDAAAPATKQDAATAAAPASTDATAQPADATKDTSKDAAPAAPAAGQ